MFYFLSLAYEQDQDPAAFSSDAQKNMKQALIMRYTLAPFWYTLHYLASTESKTIVQPLVFEFALLALSYSKNYIQIFTNNLDILMMQRH